MGGCGAAGRSPCKGLRCMGRGRAAAGTHAFITAWWLELNAGEKCVLENACCASGALYHNLSHVMWSPSWRSQPLCLRVRLLGRRAHATPRRPARPVLAPTGAQLMRAARAARVHGLARRRCFRGPSNRSVPVVSCAYTADVCRRERLSPRSGEATFLSVAVQHRSAPAKSSSLVA